MRKLLLVVFILITSPLILLAKETEDKTHHRVGFNGALTLGSLSFPIIICSISTWVWEVLSVNGKCGMRMAGHLAKTGTLTRMTTNLGISISAHQLC